MTHTRRLLVAAAAMAAMVAAVAAPAHGARVRVPGFSQAGDNALLPTDAEETESEKKPFSLESAKDEEAIRDGMNSRSVVNGAGLLSDDEARAKIAAQAEAKAHEYPGTGKPCGTWDCSGKGLCFDGVCRCHEEWHGDDCSVKYLAGEKRERRARAPVPAADATGAQTAGAAAKKQGILTVDNQEEVTPSETKALDNATKAAPAAQAPAGAEEDLADALNDEKKADDAKAGKAGATKADEKAAEAEAEANAKAAAGDVGDKPEAPAAKPAAKDAKPAAGARAEQAEAKAEQNQQEAEEDKKKETTAASQKEEGKAAAQ